MLYDTDNHRQPPDIHPTKEVISHYNQPNFSMNFILISFHSAKASILFLYVAAIACDVCDRVCPPPYSVCAREHLRDHHDAGNSIWSYSSTEAVTVPVTGYS